MKLAEARELGHECGLTTDDECVLNVEIHAASLFNYMDVETELKELHDELQTLKDNVV